MDEQKTNNKVLLIGVVLILIVGAITIFRSFMADKKSADNTGQNYENKTIELNKISPDQLRSKLATDEGTVKVLDIRGKEEFTRDHLIDSQNISADDIGGTLSSLAKENEYILIDAEGSSGLLSQSANIFQKNGFEKVFVLEGGFAAWKQTGLPSISEGNPDSFVDQSKVKYENPDDLKKTIDATPQAVAIVDVRPESEFSDAHLPNSTNLPLDLVEQKRRDLPSGKIIILYANDNLESYQAAVRLFDMGYFNVKILMGGLNGWKGKNYPVEVPK